MRFKLNFYWLLVVLVVLSVLAVWFFSQRRVRITNYPSSGRNVIAFGDSLVAGVGASAGHDFVSVLARKLAVPIINAGVSGDTTATALARLETDVLNRDPKVVLVLLGGNDYLRHFPKEETFRNLAEIVDRIQARGAVVLLLGVRGGLLRDNYEQEYKKLAKEKGAAYLNNVLKGLLGNSEYMADAIHPNDRGYQVIAERLESVLKKLLMDQ